jgi:hypothetical protein
MRVPRRRVQALRRPRHGEERLEPACLEVALHQRALVLPQAQCVLKARHDEGHGVGAGDRDVLREPGHDDLAGLHPPGAHGGGDLRKRDALVVGLHLDAQAATAGGLHRPRETRHVLALEGVGLVAGGKRPHRVGAGGRGREGRGGGEQQVSALHEASCRRMACMVSRSACVVDG